MNEKKKDVYVTRDTYEDFVRVWPATVGIRKFHGCIAWGAAWRETDFTDLLYGRKNAKSRAGIFLPSACRKHYGFYARPGTAWLIEYDAKDKMKKSKVDIDFTK